MFGHLFLVSVSDHAELFMGRNGVLVGVVSPAAAPGFDVGYVLDQC